MRKQDNLLGKLELRSLHLRLCRVIRNWKQRSSEEDEWGRWRWRAR